YRPEGCMSDIFNWCLNQLLLCISDWPWMLGSVVKGEPIHERAIVVLRPRGTGVRAIPIHPPASPGRNRGTGASRPRLAERSTGSRSSRDTVAGTVLSSRTNHVAQLSSR